MFLTSHSETRLGYPIFPDVYPFEFSKGGSVLSLWAYTVRVHITPSVFTLTYLPLLDGCIHRSIRNAYTQVCHFNLGLFLGVVYEMLVADPCTGIKSLRPNS